MTKTEIKQLVKDEMYSCIQFYVVDDATIEKLSEDEKEVFYKEFDKLANRIKKML